MKINNETEKQRFLELNINESKSGSYALVTYNNHTEAIWITKYNNWNEGDNWFLEAPCELHRCYFEDNNNDKAIRDYVLELYGDDDIENDIAYVQSMIHGNYLYEIDSPQTAPFLPDKLDDLTLISEQYCLEWLLNNKYKEV